jgi:hypothetical protein
MLPITLTTDFGRRDPYAAELLGAILSARPAAQVHSLSHDIAPQAITEAALFLAAVVPVFPPAVHLVVVDPGVGTDRRPIAVEMGDALLVGPDNGVFGRVLVRAGLAWDGDSGLGLSGARAVVLDRPAFWRRPVSATFHGRDIFGPVAAALASGTPLHDVGTPTDTLVGLEWPDAQRDGESITGTVIHIDRFGNLITTIEPGTERVVQVDVPGRQIRQVVTAYGEASGIVALVGSSGLLEIAQVNGSARDVLRIDVGAKVRATLG